MGAATLPILYLGSAFLKGGARQAGAGATAAMYRRQGMLSEQGAEMERAWAKYNASVALNESRRQAEKVGRAGELFVGETAPTYAAANVEMTGSPMDVMTNQIEAVEEKKAEVLFAGTTEATNALYRGELAAYGKITDAQNNYYLADNTMHAAAWESTGSLMGGAYKFGQMGGFNDLFGWDVG